MSAQRTNKSCPKLDYLDGIDYDPWGVGTSDDGMTAPDDLHLGKNPSIKQEPLVKQEPLKDKQAQSETLQDTEFDVDSDFEREMLKTSGQSR